MKIAFVCPHFYPHIGGVETVVMQVASNLASLGHKVTVLTQRTSRESPKRERMNNFDILRFDTFGMGELQISFELLAYLKENSKKFDLVHTHNYHSFPAFCAALTKNAPIVFSPHYHGDGHSFLTHMLHYPYRYIGKFIFSRADAITCNTEAESKLVKKHFPNVKTPTVIPLAIDLEGIQKTKKQSVPPYILSVGRLEGYKNIELIIRALQFVKDGIYLKIVGNGPEKTALKNLAKELGLKKRIFFLENISNKELFQLLKSASVYVTMSSMETYGLSLLEAVAARIGVVASDIPAHKELVKKFKIKNISLLTPTASPKEIADSITIAMTKPSEAQKNLPSWKLVAEQTLQLYKLTLNRI